MNQAETGEWRPIDSAPRDGTRVLVAVRAAEQGEGMIDLAHWARPHRKGAEPCWIAADSDPACEVIYDESEILAWMPLPSHAPRNRSAVLASNLPSPPDPEEIGGSGI